MPIARNHEPDPSRTAALPPSMTADECSEYRAQTGRCHPRSRWCGLITGQVCGATALPCDGRCAALVAAERSGERDT